MYLMPFRRFEKVYRKSHSVDYGGVIHSYYVVIKFAAVEKKCTLRARINAENNNHG
jgi:hypothetical protein